MKTYIILVLLTLLPMSLYSPATIKKDSDYKNFRIYELQKAELTLDNVKEYLQLSNVSNPIIVLSQFVLETGHGKSYVCKTFNNLFGLRTSTGYIKFTHWTESISSTTGKIGYKQLQDKKYKGGCYYSFLVKMKYAEASNYISVLKIIEKQLQRKYNC